MANADPNLYQGRGSYKYHYNISNGHILINSQ
jgi:hypothetical protein